MKKVKKIAIFPKGVTHGFGPKLAIFSTSFFRQYRPGKCVLRYFRAENAFLGFKNKKFKKSKNWPFPKGVNQWFKSKKGYFSEFFFLDIIGQENVFYDILEQKNAFLGYKNKNIKKSKNWHFSEGVNLWFWSRNCPFFNFFFLANIG